MPETVTYLAFEPLPADAQPARRVHAHGATLFTIDPRTTRLAFMLWVVDQWTDDEQAALRAAYGQPPSGPIADWLLEPEPCVLYVPRELRLPGWPALQGGAELCRRFRKGQLGTEYDLLTAERFADYGEEPPTSYLSRLEPA